MSTNNKPKPAQSFPKATKLGIGILLILTLIFIPLALATIIQKTSFFVQASALCDGTVNIQPSTTSRNSNVNVHAVANCAPANVVVGQMLCLVEDINARNIYGSFVTTSFPLGPMSPSINFSFTLQQLSNSSRLSLVGNSYYVNCQLFDTQGKDILFGIANPNVGTFSCTDCNSSGGGPFCGDKICSAGENIYTCPSDCQGITRYQCGTSGLGRCATMKASIPKGYHSIYSGSNNLCSSQLHSNAYQCLYPYDQCAANGAGLCSLSIIPCTGDYYPAYTNDHSNACHNNGLDGYTCCAIKPKNIGSCAGLSPNQSACMQTSYVPAADANVCPGNFVKWYRNQPSNNHNGSCGLNTTSSTYTCCIDPSKAK